MALCPSTLPAVQGFFNGLATTLHRRRVFLLAMSVVLISAASSIPALAQTVTATINVGSYPIPLALNPSTNQVYVVNEMSGNVTVIDGASKAATATLNVGASPSDVAVNPATDLIYVSNSGS